jgi:hypothetical protein
MTDHCFIQLMGGLGNQMFQIATAYAHSKRTGRTLKVSQRTVGGRDTYWDTWFSKLKDTISARKSGVTWAEPGFSYTPIPVTATVLNGYFQSSLYFQDYADDIRSLFHPGNTIDMIMRSRHAVILAKKGVGTVIHIRRGDYLALPELHGILTAGWFRNACMGRDPADLVVFSDDLAWCREQDFLKGATFVDEPDAAVALHLMSQFSRFILSNSSFSWWAAWLAGADADVVVPDRWFGPAGPQNTVDIYEPSWKRLPLS